MKNLSVILMIASDILLIVAIISHITVTPISFIAPKVESQALGRTIGFNSFIICNIYKYIE
jgi:hypothetical protein